MSPAGLFRLIYAPEVLDPLDWIDRKYHSLIRQTIQTQLIHAPDILTRNRKLLEQPTPFGATWELRLDPKNRFRVFYEVDEEGHEIRILAIGTKDGNRLYVSEEEYIVE